MNERRVDWLMCAVALLALAGGCSSDSSQQDGGPKDGQGGAEKPPPGQEASVPPDGVGPNPDGPLTDAQIIPVTGNDKCAGAHELQLVGGKAAASGDTSPMTDEFATLACGATLANDTLPGRQAYFKFMAKASQWYKVELSPGFDASPFIFTSASCSQAAIEADCQSDGASGLVSRVVDRGTRQALYFKSPAADYVYVGVDSADPAQAGPFSLAVGEFALPTNITCLQAAPLEFVGNAAQISGDTGPMAPAEFPSLRCEITTMRGPQVYYAFLGRAGVAYKIQITAEAGQYLYTYVFRDRCTEPEISQDCSSEGATGLMLLAPVVSGESGEIAFTPASDGTLIVAVGSMEVFNYGSFTLKVSY